MNTSKYKDFEEGVRALIQEDIPESFKRNAFKYTDEDRQRNAEIDSVLEVSLEMLQKPFTL